MAIASTPDDPAATRGPEPGFTHRRFFAALRTLGRLRVISRSGPSTFEALVGFGPFGFGHGHMNAITDAYHWHLALDRFGYLRSCDRVHERSGRRVLFFELRETPDAEPFLLIYLHREKGEEFDPELERRFAELHADLAEGRSLAADGDPT
ncbi:hypothetical protein MYXO_01277 [Myxococcaceae bacterium]|jgi:hypothetical protein|nr:hypothetical protein MYXO_01277 [Myxococcaceae bacterium]